MKKVGICRAARTTEPESTKARLATSVQRYTVTFHTDATAKSEERYVANASPQRRVQNFEVEMDPPPDESLPFIDPSEDVSEDASGALPAYETIPASEGKAAKIRQNVAHMNELRAEEAIFLQLIISRHYSSQVLTPCLCGIDSHVRKVACEECLQAELLCRQCWLNKHQQQHGLSLNHIVSNDGLV
ncbi:hypothetical protein DFH09DRAFT_1331063 [Mycena vulgaris]|nr:hypothetical protein DFH09DRAFT_1331063 [Mycena vulgaris]